MAHRHFLLLALSALMTGLPLTGEAVQISPNPNPAGSTINIVNDPTAFNALNPFTNEGTINIDAASTLTNQAGATLANQFTPQDSVIGFVENFGQFTNNGTLTTVSLGNRVGGQFTNTNLTTGGQLYNDGSLVNTSSGVLQEISLITNNPSGTSTNSGVISDSYIENYGSFTNSGLLRFSNVFTSGMSNSGTWDNSGAVENHAGVANNGQLTNTGTINTLSNNAFFSNSSLLTNAGTMTVSATDSLHLASIGGSGVWTNVAGSKVTVGDNGAFVNSGSLINQAGSVQSISQFGQLLNRGTLTHAGTLTNDGVFTNGVFQQSFDDNGNVTSSFMAHGNLINTGSITGTGTYTQILGDTINNGTLAQLGGVNIQRGKLSGLGTITTPTLTVASGATVSPGTATQLGTLTLNGNLQSSGNLNFRFGGLNAGQFDVLKVNGTASFTGGNLVFNFANGFAAAAGNSWQFLTASAIAGWNSLLVSINGLASGLGYEITSANGAQILTITGAPVSVPEPGSLLLLGLGLAGLIGLRKKLL